MVQKRRVDKRKEKRRLKRQARIDTVSTRISVETGLCSQTGKTYVIGKVDGKVVYTSKVTRSQDHVGRKKQTWVKRMARRIVTSN